MAKTPRSVSSITTNTRLMEKPVEDVPAPTKMGDSPNTANFAKQKLEKKKAARLPFDQHYQAIAELVDSSNADFQESHLTDGSFTQDDVYDSTAARGSQIAGAAFVGMLWPNGAKSVQVALKHPDALGDKESVEWCQRSNLKFVSALDDPRGNLNNALGELMEDGIKYGTTVLTRVPGGQGRNEPVFYFDAWNVRNFYIGQGRNRSPDELDIVYKMTAEEMVKRFGFNNCAKAVQDAYNAGKLDNKFDYLHAIGPRYARDPKKKGPLNSPISSCHYDLSNGKKLKESGFNRRAFYCLRFYLRPGEVYARSPVMAALPDIYLANALKEAIIIATEKQLDPPLGILDDSTLGNAVVDTSAGGISVFNPPQGGGNAPPVFPIYTVGDLKSAMALLEELHENISNHLFLDRLLNLNNETQMTAREAMIRDAMRSSTLRTPINRCISDVFTPMVEDSWMDMLDRGHFGVIPGSPEWLNAQTRGGADEEVPEVIARLLAEGEEVFEVQYLTPAMRDMKADEAQAIIDQFGLVANLAAVYPQARNQLNVMRSLDRLAKIRGVPVDLLNTEKERKEIEAIQNQQQQEQAVLNNLNQAATVAKQLGVTNANAPTP